MKQTKKKATDFSIRLENITKKYENLTAVNSVSFSAQSGEIIALLGPNGAGKSTLMNMISGFLAPTSGQIFINGKNIAEESVFAKKNTGFLPEGAPMYADMSVSLFLKYMIELKLNLSESDNLSKQQIKTIYQNEFNRITETANIKDILPQRIETLSKGYLRRTGFAQSIIGNPPILLLDEPTDGLDPNQKEHIRNLIKNMGKHKTILISTHLLDEAETLATRILLINRGNLKADGSLEDILNKTKSESIAEAFKKMTTTAEKKNEQH